MSKLKKMFYYWIFPASLYSLITAFAFAIAAQLGSLTQTMPVLSLSGLSLISLFCFLFALINCIFRVGRFSMPLKVFLHFISTMASFFVTFILIGQYYKNGQSAAVILMLFAVIYWIFMIVYLIIRALKNAALKDKDEYKKQF